MTKLKLQKSERKNNLRITAKYHAHFQTLTKTPSKFRKEQAKTVGRVVYTRYPVSICFGRSYAQTAEKVTKLALGLQPNVMHIC